MLYSILKWGALAAGAWRGLHRRKPAMTVASFDKVFKEVWLPAIREELKRDYSALYTESS